MDVGTSHSDMSGMYPATCSLCLQLSSAACTGIETDVVDSVCRMLELDLEQYSPFLATFLICPSCQAFLAEIHQMLETLTCLKKQLERACKKLAEMFINMPEVRSQSDSHELLDEKPVLESLIIKMSDFCPLRDPDELMDSLGDSNNAQQNRRNPSDLTSDSCGTGQIFETRTVLPILDLKEEDEELPVSAAKKLKPTIDAIGLKPCVVRLTPCRVPVRKAREDQQKENASENVVAGGDRPLNPLTQPSITATSCTGITAFSNSNLSGSLYADKGTSDSEHIRVILSHDTHSSPHNTDPEKLSSDTVTNCRRLSRIQLKINAKILVAEEIGSEGTSSDFEPNDEADPSSDSDSEFQLKLHVNKSPSKRKQSTTNVSTTTAQIMSTVFSKSLTDILEQSQDFAGFLKRTTTDADYVELAKKLPNGRFACTKCSRVFKNLKGAIYHGKRHYVFYECHSCRQAYVHPHQHITCVLAEAAPPSGLPYKCTHALCNGKGRTFGTEQELKYHNLKSFICSVGSCTYEVDSVTGLRHHEFEHEFASEYGHFSCPVCSFRFPAQEQLDSHLSRFHSAFTGKRSYACPACPKVLSSVAVLEFHYKATHSQIDPESNRKTSTKWTFCTYNYCQYQCRGPRTLQVHIRRVHDGDPNLHRCETCPKKYATRGHLLVHIFAAHAPDPS